MRLVVTTEVVQQNPLCDQHSGDSVALPSTPAPVSDLPVCICCDLFLKPSLVSSTRFRSLEGREYTWRSLGILESLADLCQFFCF